MSEKITVASDWMCGCAGCHMSLLDIDERIVTLVEHATLTSTPIRLTDSILFDVPEDELRRIPYPIGTLMRMVPQTNQLLQPLHPSRWFKAGIDLHPSANFSIHCDEHGFHHIHYVMSESMYEELILNAFRAYAVLVAVPNPF
jgi:hypothetical protein